MAWEVFLYGVIYERGDVTAAWYYTGQRACRMQFECISAAVQRQERQFSERSQIDDTNGMEQAFIGQSSSQPPYTLEIHWAGGPCGSASLLKFPSAI